MRFSVLDAARPEEHARWVSLWEAWPGREVMGHPEYARLFARPCDRVVCAVGEDAGGAVLFPLLLRPLAAEPWASPDEDRWDATSPYGYGGPFAWGEGPRDDAAFWRGYAAFCREARLVTTFARLSLFPDQLAALRGPVEDRGPSVVRSLELGPEAIWADYNRQARANVRAAQRAGVRVELDTTGARLDAFLAIYGHTMERRGASAWYRFPRAFFEALVSRLPGQFLFVHALAGRDVVSSELILVSVENTYVFLSGTHSDAYPMRPNDLVRHETVLWGVAHGRKRHVLGGGYEPGDGVYRHKHNLAPKGDVPFRVLQEVHDPEGAEGLARDRAAHAGRAGAPWAPRPAFFPAYRS